jgi:hypothetical protein
MVGRSMICEPTGIAVTESNRQTGVDAEAGRVNKT